MGDRIVIRITDVDRRSPDLYCHWAGLRAVKAVHDALPESRRDIHNLICNVIVKVMCGECSDASYYLYDSGEAEGMADWDNWTWTFDLATRTWRSTMPQLEGRLLTISEADDFVRSVRPCLYSECPCDSFDLPSETGKPRYSDTVYTTREGC